MKRSLTISIKPIWRGGRFLLKLLVVFWKLTMVNFRRKCRKLSSLNLIKPMIRGKSHFWSMPQSKSCQTRTMQTSLQQKFCTIINLRNWRELAWVNSLFCLRQKLKTQFSINLVLKSKTLLQQITELNKKIKSPKSNKMSPFSCNPTIFPNTQAIRKLLGFSRPSSQLNPSPRIHNKVWVSESWFRFLRYLNSKIN